MKVKSQIVIYMDPAFEPEECQACDVEDLSEMGGNFCAYRIEIPCESISVECGEPRDVNDGTVLGSEGECTYANLLFRRNLTRGARSESDCFINGSADWGRLFCRVRGPRGGGEILTQNTVSLRFC
jgi:hypothetical protein